jgi:predicted transcriptional regulator
MEQANFISPINKPVPELEDVIIDILQICQVPQDRESILRHIQVQNTSPNYQKYIYKLVKTRYLLESNTRESYNSIRYYTTTQKGLNYLKAVA